MPRELPEYISQLSIGSFQKIEPTGLQSQANASRQMSAELGAVAEDMNRKAREIEELRVKTTFRENLDRIYRENPNNPAAVKSQAEGFMKTYIPGIGNATLREKMSIVSNSELQPYVDKATESYNRILDNEHQVERYKAISRNTVDIGNAAEMFVTAETPEARAAAQKVMEGLVEENVNLVSSTDSRGMSQFTPEKQVSVLRDGQRAILDALPADKRIEALGGGKGGFEAASVLVRRHEGGLNVNDGNTGNPAIFGINRKWHEKAFDKVKAVYDTQGAAAGQAAADLYLKEQFWDRYNLDALSPQQQGIVYDGAVNHHQGFVDKLVKAAKEGAPPSELLEMRQNEYDRLAATGKYSKQDVASWNNRLSDYSHLIINEYTDFLPPEDKQRALDESIKQFESEGKRANVMRVMDAARQDEAIYTKFVNNEPGVLQSIEDYRNNGGNAELADHMRSSALKTQQMPEEQKNNLTAELSDRVRALGLKKKGDGEYKVTNDSITLESAVELYNDIMKAEVQGVSGLSSQLRNASTAIVSLGKNELGSDDPGLGIFGNDPDEAFDPGYDIIQSYLEGQDKEKNYSEKALMLRKFIDRANKIPEDIRGDEELFKQAQARIANSVVAENAQGGLKNVPASAISFLIENPTLAGEFDKKFGAGKAAKVLGQ